MFQQRRRAYATVHGLANHPGISGIVDVFPAGTGSWIRADIRGLPVGNSACEGKFFGFHVHEGSSCNNPMGHYNPNQCQHPNHAGDLPPLLGDNGHAFAIFYTDRFSPEDIIGKTFIIHANPDDFTTQPSGNSGEMIACGEITAI